MAEQWQVQRRLPGTQGENGCWQDAGVAEAESALNAVACVAQDAADSQLNGEWRAAPMPQWESFWPRPAYEPRIRRLEIEPASVPPDRKGSR